MSQKEQDQTQQSDLQLLLKQKDEQIQKLQELVKDQQLIIKGKDDEIDKLREQIYRLALDEQEAPTSGQRGYSRRDMFTYILGSPLIVDFHRQLEIIRKERKYYVFTEAETYKQQVISSLNHLKKTFKELLKEGCRSLNTSWKNVMLPEPISISDAVEMTCTMSVLTAAKTGSEKQVSTEDFLRIRDAFLQAIEESSQWVQDYNQITIDPQVLEQYRKKYGLDQTQASAMFTKYLQILVTQLFYIIDLQ